MKKITFLSFTLLFVFSFTQAQIKTPDKRPFNIGIFSGIGGVNFTPIPGVDLHYKGTLLRIAPGYRVIGGGLIREIMPLSEVFYNWYWTASIYAAKGKEDDLYGSGQRGVTLTSDYYKGIVLTGAKVYFNTRLYTQLQGGISYTKYQTEGYPSSEEWTPYFEFSLGINIFRNYTNEMDFNN